MCGTFARVWQVYKCPGSNPAGQRWASCPEQREGSTPLPSWEPTLRTLLAPQQPTSPQLCAQVVCREADTRNPKLCGDAVQMWEEKRGQSQRTGSVRMVVRAGKQGTFPHTRPRFRSAIPVTEQPRCLAISFDGI